MRLKIWPAVLLGSATAFLIHTPTVWPHAEPEVAEVRITSSHIYWEPVMGSEQISLTIKGSNGIVIQRVFAKGHSPLLPLVDEDGLPLPDGTYNYHLTVESDPDPALMEALKAAQQDGDSKTATEIGVALQDSVHPEPVATQGGAFVIEGGQIVEIDKPDDDADDHSHNHIH